MASSTFVLRVIICNVYTLYSLSREGWEQSRACHELYFSSGHCLKMLWANTGYLNGTAVHHLYSLKFSSKPWWLEQRPGKNRGFLLPESGPQVASGKDRPHILSDPLWRWPYDITCCVKKALWDDRTVCIRASKSRPGGESFWEKPRFRGLFETQRWWKGSAFCLTANKPPQI